MGAEELDGWALRRAIVDGDLPLVRRALEAGAAVEAEEPTEAWALSPEPLFETVCRCENPVAAIEIANALLDHGLDVADADSEGRTALHYAARSGSVPLTELFLQHGADAGHRDERGHTAFYFATYSRHGSVVQVLRNHGYDEVIPDDEIPTCEGCGQPRSEPEAPLTAIVRYRCRCGEIVQIERRYIDEERGIAVKCHGGACGRIATIPNTVLCSFCGINLERDWERKIRW